MVRKNAHYITRRGVNRINYYRQQSLAIIATNERDRSLKYELTVRHDSAEHLLKSDVWAILTAAKASQDPKLEFSVQGINLATS